MPDLLQLVYSTCVATENVPRTTLLFFIWPFVIMLLTFKNGVPLTLYAQGGVNGVAFCVVFDIHCTASIKPRLLFPHAKYASLGFYRFLDKSYNCNNFMFRFSACIYTHFF